MQRRPSSHSTEQAATGLGTFGGVFTPSILTILGVIMYLRFGWVVGNVGLWGTLAIVTISTSITLVTALSISAIATAQRVEGGGAYFMISRSLGIEAGGAVGIPLYIAQALSVALYTIGFAESITAVFPSMNVKWVALITTIAVTLVAFKSAKAAIKAQYVIMGAIGLSLVSLLLGSPIPPDAAVTGSGEPAAFWVVFAVFFPAVTGIMAGVNMSGDLAEPERSIPRGTLAAVAVGYAIYMGIPLLLTQWATPEQLIADPLVMRRMAFWGDAILLGVWGATLSSAVGSILGAPRVLQALARDGVLPRAFTFLGRGSGDDDEPRVGTAFTFALVACTVLLGSLNAIAPVLTMFFLTTYGVLNITAGLERFLGNPSYRPKFGVHWFWSVAGAFGCVAVMFLINTPATVGALTVVVVIYAWLERQELRSAWGDVRRGIWLNITRTGLLHLRTAVDAKNWRPHLLVLSGAPTRRWHLVEFASSLSHNRALMTVASVLPDQSVTPERVERMTSSVYDYLDRQGIQALVRIITAPDAFEGSRRLIQTYGLGTLVPNTVILGMTEDPAHADGFVRLIRSLHDSKRNTLIVRHDAERDFGNHRTIDVWWGGLKGNGALMLILAWLVSTSMRWRGSRIVIRMVVPTQDAAAGASANLESIVQESRTGAAVDVQVADGRPFETILKETSANSDLVFLGMAEPGTGFSDYFTGLQDRTTDLPTTIFVLAAEQLEFGDVI